MNIIYVNRDRTWCIEKSIHSSYNYETGDRSPVEAYFVRKNLGNILFLFPNWSWTSSAHFYNLDQAKEWIEKAEKL